MSGKGSRGTMRIFCQHLLLSNVSVQRLLHLDFCELRKELVLNLILTVVKWHDCRFTISAETKAWLGVLASAFSWVAESSTAAGKKNQKAIKNQAQSGLQNPSGKQRKYLGCWLALKSALPWLRVPSQGNVITHWMLLAIQNSHSIGLEIPANVWLQLTQLGQGEEK